MFKFMVATILFFAIGNVINTALPIEYSMLMLIALPVLYFIIYHKVFHIKLFNKLNF